MEVVAVYSDKPYTFSLVSVGGDTSPTKTQGIGNIQQSRITVALHDDIEDMLTLYLLLVNLTRNAWGGMMVYVQDLNTRPPELTSWQVRRSRPNEGEDGVYICTVGYKVNMPSHTLNYTMEETNE